MILIVIYVGINLAYNGLDTLTAISNFDIKDPLSIGGEFDGDTVKVGSSSFTKIDNFTYKKSTNHQIKAINYENNVSIYVKQLDDSQDIEKTVDKFLYGNNTRVTSNQTISQNGITAYFLYKETEEKYDADIYVKKDGKKYLIRGVDINYENSDFFIDNCKTIINRIKPD